MFVFDAQLRTDVIPVGHDGIHGQVQALCNLFGRHALLDQGGDLDFIGRQPDIV